MFYIFYFFYLRQTSVVNSISPIYYTLYYTIRRSLLRAVEFILNRPITNFYNSHDVNIRAAGLRQTKTRPIYFVMKENLLYETKSARCK